MARKQTRERTIKEIEGETKFDFISKKMGFDIEREVLNDIGITNESPIEEDLAPDNNDSENVSDNITDEKQEETIEDTKQEDSDEKFTPRPEPLDTSKLTDEEMLAIIAERKRRTKPEKTYYEVPNSDGTIPQEVVEDNQEIEDDSEVTIEHAEAHKEEQDNDVKGISSEEKETLSKVLNEKINVTIEQKKVKPKSRPKVAKTFKLPEELVDELDSLFRDSNGKMISGTKGMLSVLVSNAIVEYLVSQGFKDKEYLSNLQDFKK